jgi:hypothetical protein
LLRASIGGGFQRGLDIFRRDFSLKQFRGLLLELAGHEAHERAGIAPQIGPAQSRHPSAFGWPLLYHGVRSRL